MIKFLDLSWQYQTIKEEVQNAISEVLESASFVGGHFVENFENQLANFLGVSHTLGVGNGTDALELALQALCLPKGSEVILPANTFFASLEAVVRVGLTPILVDCGEDYCIDIQSIQNAITPKTSAIMPVHLYGKACAMEQILQIAKTHQLKVIEDCAQSIGAEIEVFGERKKTGSIGDIGCFSFYPGKNLGAYGDGGAISTNDPKLYAYIKSLANHGRSENQKYQHLYFGRNSRLDSIQANILSIKLKYLPLWNQKRQENARLYCELLQDCPNLVLPPMTSSCVWHLFVIRVQKPREAVLEALNNAGIQTGIHYPIDLASLEATKGLFQSHCPNAQAYAKQILSLPMGEHLSSQEIEKVAMRLKEILA